MGFEQACGGSLALSLSGEVDAHVVFVAALSPQRLVRAWQTMPFLGSSFSLTERCPSGAVEESEQ